MECRWIIGLLVILPSVLDPQIIGTKLVSLLEGACGRLGPGSAAHRRLDSHSASAKGCQQGTVEGPPLRHLETLLETEAEPVTVGKMAQVEGAAWTEPQDHRR